MAVKTLKEKLFEIDDGMFIPILTAVSIKDICGECDFFNPTINDERKQYRCHAMPFCISATLHPNVQSYFHEKLGWISKETYYKNIGLTAQ